MADLTLNFYRTSGKWYASGNAKTSHQIFEGEFVQDIVNTQDALVDGWNESDDFLVTVDNVGNDVREFHKCLLRPEDVRGFRKEAE